MRFLTHEEVAALSDAIDDLAIAAGADVKVLQRMLGSASAALTLDRYGHLLPGQARTVADRLDEMARAAVPISLAPAASLISSAGCSRDESARSAVTIRHTTL